MSIIVYRYFSGILLTFLYSFGWVLLGTIFHFSTAGLSKNKDSFEEPDSADEAPRRPVTGHHGVIDSQSSFFLLFIG